MTNATETVVAPVNAAPIAEVNGPAVEVLEFRLSVKGVFGRNRKAKFHTLHLFDRAIGFDVTSPEVAAAAEAAIRDLKCKVGCLVRVIATPTKVERVTYDGGLHVVTSRSFMLMSGETAWAKVVGA